ncbi:MAG: AAA family ATPase [Acidobacteria bacterium]|nr:AAA family ATPase [Acidobacteriota bacterium]
MNCVITFSGFNKSGKTSLARLLAQEQKVAFASFGDFVRKEAHRRGFSDPSRKQLQDIGQALAETNMKGFCLAVLEDAGFVWGNGIIVDGIRHLSAIEMLRDVIPHQPLKLVYVTASIEERISRSSLSRSEVVAVDSHIVESDNEALSRAADFVLQASGSLEESFLTLRKWVLENCS